MLFFLAPGFDSPHLHKTKGAAGRFLFDGDGWKSYPTPFSHQKNKKSLAFTVRDKMLILYDSKEVSTTNTNRFFG